MARLIADASLTLSQYSDRQSHLPRRLGYSAGPRSREVIERDFEGRAEAGNAPHNRV
jgi:hypothetical protein